MNSGSWLCLFSTLLLAGSVEAESSQDPKEIVFAPITSLEKRAPGTPTFLAIEDLNSDQAPDLLVGYCSKVGLAVYLNNGQGGFREPIRYGTDCISEASVGDLDGDGHLDVVAARRKSPLVMLLFGDGQGRFHRFGRVVARSQVSRIAVGDVNGDSHLDIAAQQNCQKEWKGEEKRLPDCEKLGQLDVFFGNGKGEFPSKTETESPAWVVDLKAADLNQDAVSDLVAWEAEEDNLIPYYGQMNRTLRRGSSIFVGAWAWGRMTVSDLDQDGSPEIVAPRTLSLGNYLNAGELTLVSTNNGKFKVRERLRSQAAPTDVEALDLDQDGDFDLITANLMSQSISIFLQDESGSFESVPALLSEPRPHSLASGDLNLDGAPDIVVGFSGPPFLGVYFSGTGDDGSMAARSSSLTWVEQFRLNPFVWFGTALFVMASLPLLWFLWQRRRILLWNRVTKDRRRQLALEGKRSLAPEKLKKLYQSRPMLFLFLCFLLSTVPHVYEDISKSHYTASTWMILLYLIAFIVTIRWIFHPVVKIGSDHMVLRMPRFQPSLFVLFDQIQEVKSDRLDTLIRLAEGDLRRKMRIWTWLLSRSDRELIRETLEAHVKPS